MFIDNEYTTSFTHDYFDFPVNFPFPAAIMKKITNYEDVIWEKWSDCDTALLEAVHALAGAPERDNAILTAAVKAGKAHPGRPTHDAARLALDYQKEASKQATDEARAAVAEIVRDMTKIKDALITEAIKIEREQIEESRRLYVAAEQAARTAEAATHQIGSVINWMTERVGGTAYRQFRIEAQVNTVNFPEYSTTPDMNQTRSRVHLEMIEDIVNPHAIYPLVRNDFEKQDGATLDV